MLDFSKTDFSVVEDISESQLAPHGTLVLLNVKEIGKLAKNTNGKTYSAVTFEVAEGAYAGKIIKENYYLEGKDFALQKTKILIRYTLETTTEAHKTGNYAIQNMKAIETGQVVAKLGVKGFIGQNGDWIHTNEIAALATPREDSSTYKYYLAYKRGEQPFQTDYKPEKPTAIAGGYTASNDFGEPPAGHPAGDSYGF